jgi:hypothetical protein
VRGRVRVQGRGKIARSSLFFGARSSPTPLSLQSRTQTPRVLNQQAVIPPSSQTLRQPICPARAPNCTAMSARTISKGRGGPGSAAGGGHGGLFKSRRARELPRDSSFRRRLAPQSDPPPYPRPHPFSPTPRAQPHKYPAPPPLSAPIIHSTHALPKQHATHTTHTTQTKTLSSSQHSTHHPESNSRVFFFVREKKKPPTPSPSPPSPTFSPHHPPLLVQMARHASSLAAALLLGKFFSARAPG